MISVIMPLYDAAKYLSQALDSVLGQTLTDWELIAVCEPDSSDGTNEIIARYAQSDGRIKPLLNSRHLGIAASLNAGLRAAKGEYIARMDGDDVCVPERFAKQVEFLKGNPDVAVVGSNFRFINNKGKPGRSMSNLPTDHEQIKSDLMFYCNLNHPTVMTRKSDIEKHNLYYDENYTASEDFELWNRAKHTVRFANVPEALLNYRWNFNSSTVRNAEIGDARYTEVIDRNCRELGLSFTREELRVLYRRSCDLSLTNAKHIKSTLEKAASRIIDANNVSRIYEPRALEDTLNKHMYWKRRPARNIVAETIRSAFGKSYEVNAVARYLEYYGFKATLQRIRDAL
jgi:glycosyltransferase involved in cell wall biosynthesis